MPGDQSRGLSADGARLEQPLLARVEDGERPPQRGAGRLGQRRDATGQLPRAADGEAGRRVAELAAEVGVVVHLGLADGEAGRRALLAVVAEGRADEIADGLVAIGQRRDDDGVLAAGLREQRQIRTPAEEEPRGLHRTGQDDAVHPRVGDEPAADLVVGARQELEDSARDAARSTGSVASSQPTSTASGAGLSTTALPAAKRGEHAAGRDGQRKVPGRGHDHHAERLAAAIVELVRRPREGCGRSSARSRPLRRPRRPPPSRSWRRRASSRRSARRAAARAPPRTPPATRPAPRRAAPPSPAGHPGRRSARDRRRRGRPARNDRPRARGATGRASPPPPRPARRSPSTTSGIASGERSLQRRATSTIQARFTASVQSVSGSFSNLAPVDGTLGAAVASRLRSCVRRGASERPAWRSNAARKRSRSAIHAGEPGSRSKT